MRTSFQRLWENASKNGYDFWDKGLSSGDLDKSAMDVIKRGIEIRPDRSDGNTFWDDFVSVFSNNVDGAAKLLDVNPNVVGQWAATIKRGLSNVKGDDTDKKTDVMKTGESL